MKKILLLAEHQSDALKKITLELVTVAKKIADLKNMSIQALIIGHEIDNAAMELAGFGLEVLAVKTKTSNGLSGYSLITLIDYALKQEDLNLNPDYIISGNTASGAAVMPGITVKIPGTTMISGVKSLLMENGTLYFLTTVLNGRYDLKTPAGEGKMALTIQPGVFEPCDQKGDKPGDISYTKAPCDDNRVSVEGVVVRDTESESSFSNAKVIVSSGRGIEKKENLDTIKNFSKLFEKSACGGSRPLIDSGWMPYKNQVGITGKIVSPEIYIALGISGSSQHIAGMKNSGFIISVNKDANAAIFNYSDICIVADIFDFIEQFNEC
jgi:electron transfer flavoprotein alpha subunit